jgi:hypothetical protein
MTSAYIVCFETSTPAAKAAIVEGIKAYGFYCPINETAWIVKTDRNAVAIREHLGGLIGANDRVFVLRSGTEAAWKNSYGPKHDEWLKAHL